MKRLMIPVFAIGLILASAAVAQISYFDVMLEDVELRPGVTADINVRVFVNDSQPCQGRTVMLVPGAWGSADPAWWWPFLEAFFTDNPAGRKGCRFAILELPAHGGSGLPEGGPIYGELTQTDYAAAVIGALERLPDWGVKPKTILAYSMGGIVTALAQQTLVDQGTNLREAFNIQKVVLLSPVPPAETPWSVADWYGYLFGEFYSCYTGPGGVVIPGCEWLDVEPDVGVDFHDLLWFDPTLTWDCDPDTTPLGQPPLPAPVAEGLCDSTTPYGDTFFDYGTHEPATALYEIFGGFQYQRPITDRGIFGPRSRTTLYSIGLELDTTIFPEETAASYEHYADDPELEGFVLVEGPTTDHLMIFIDPVGLLEGIAGKVEFP